MDFYLPIIITMVFFCLQARGIQKGILWASFSVALLYMILVFKIVPKSDWAVILGLCCICFWLMFRAAWATQPKY
ncbi:hypothetical protein BK130_18850 [Viridibacillus sp. FSL H8-0123]|nr:hypothetical protein BK130_18850 [Viridibacillus sp. FSL H8-0123]OMC86482.1 hypothetical protein BK128_10465 [Viridibacillus sp. FSL H7-0596]